MALALGLSWGFMPDSFGKLQRHFVGTFLWGRGRAVLQRSSAGAQGNSDIHIPVGGTPGSLVTEAQSPDATIRLLLPLGTLTRQPLCGTGSSPFMHQLPLLPSEFRPSFRLLPAIPRLQNPRPAFLMPVSIANAPDVSVHWNYLGRFEVTVSRGIALWFPSDVWPGSLHFHTARPTDVAGLNRKQMLRTIRLSIESQSPACHGFNEAVIPGFSLTTFWPSQGGLLAFPKDASLSFIPMLLSFYGQHTNHLYQNLVSSPKAQLKSYVLSPISSCIPTDGNDLSLG